MFKPLSYPIIDWNSLNTVCSEALGHSATRGLDAANIPTDKVTAFLHAAGLNNNNHYYRQDDNILKFMSFSFIGTADVDQLLYMYPTGLAIHAVESETRGIFVCILSSHLLGWRDAIYSLAKTKKTRSLANELLGFFEIAGFKDLWSRYTRHTLADGSFELR